MSIRLIRKNNAPCLYKKCREVTAFDRKLSELIDDMFETMYDANGCGLAGPQVGILRRVAVIDITEDKSAPMELVNPRILAYAGKQGDLEGCLSFPNKQGYVERPNCVTVEAYDRHGELHQYTAEGLLARCIFHELDHLDGVVYLTKVTEPPEDFKKE